MFYLSLNIYKYDQSGYRQYWSVIGDASGHADSKNLEMHLEAIVVGKSVSHHHCYSVWWGEADRGHTEIQG